MQVHNTCLLLFVGRSCHFAQMAPLFSWKASILSSIPVLISVSTVTDDDCFTDTRNQICGQGFPWRVGPRSFDENSRKAVKEEKIKSAALSALVSADPPWESLWDHNTSHKTAGAWPAIWKGPASQWVRERWTGEGKEWTGGGEKKKSFWYTQVEWGS